MRILIGFSRNPDAVSLLRDRGHEAWTCDLRPADHPWHIQGDLFEVALRRPWDWAVFHYPCTYLTTAGAWAFNDPDQDRWPGVGYHQRVKPETLTGLARRAARAKAVHEVQTLMALPYRKAIENPGRSFLSTYGLSPDQTVQPYDFGDDTSKLTGFWLDRLPKVTPTARVRGRMVEWPRGSGKMVERWGNQSDNGAPKEGPSADRWANRSASFPGLMRAAVSQWCDYMDGIHDPQIERAAA